MKKQIVLMVLAILPVFLLAQTSPLIALYEKYADKPGFESSEIIPGSMSFEWEKDMKFEAVREMLKEIKGIRILKYKVSATNKDESKIWKKIEKTAGEDPYKKVVAVHADKTHVSIYLVQDPGGITKEIALTAMDEKGITLVTVDGNIDFSALFSKENMHSLREMAEYCMHNKWACTPDKK
jgi:hypothetical protein